MKIKYEAVYFDCDNEDDLEYCESFSKGSGCAKRGDCKTYERLQNGKNS